MRIADSKVHWNRTTTSTNSCEDKRPTRIILWGTEGNTGAHGDGQANTENRRKGIREKLIYKREIAGGRGERRYTRQYGEEIT